MEKPRHSLGRGPEQPRCRPTRTRLDVGGKKGAEALNAHRHRLETRPDYLMLFAREIEAKERARNREKENDRGSRPSPHLSRSY